MELTGGAFRGGEKNRAGQVRESEREKEKDAWASGSLSPSSQSGAWLGGHGATAGGGDASEQLQVEDEDDGTFADKPLSFARNKPRSTAAGKSSRRPPVLLFS